MPNRLLDCVDDPYRGLVTAVRKNGGFAKVQAVNHQEFLWSAYFYTRVKWNDADDADYKRAVAEATRLAHDPAASDLPGYSAGAREVFVKVAINTNV